ncbi:hypothetical protein, conserved [Eimeria acervulina]|uniref:Btz domain-containing protein n=1 Tax=Eimeria acervulina TaxID=5801 RepID=U6GBA6_EIMAC|nr:hypothetical protein, conserved [Eimeria acervulina]CDI76603.1 hypothetical protein, conserved [Eimeria acervulina]
MGNPRNLRRTSSQEEDEGDVFDEKSDISSGSETEEEAPADAVPSGGPTDTTAATAGAGDAAAPPASSSNKDDAHDPSQGPSAAASNAQASSEPTREAENEVQRETEQANDEGARHRRSAAAAEGTRQRPKSTWQLMQEDPSYVPRATRYFLHDDRREGDSGESDGSEEGSGSQPDDSVPQSTQTRVGTSKKLWTPDENKGMWKHDMWELLQKEEAGERPPGGGWTRGRQFGEEAVEKPGCLEALEGRGKGEACNFVLPLVLRFQMLQRVWLMRTNAKGGEAGGLRGAAGEARTGAAISGSITYPSRHRNKLQRQLERRRCASVVALMASTPHCSPKEIFLV